LNQLADLTLLLPPQVGGLEKGTLNGETGNADDVADQWLDQHDQRRRERHLSDKRDPDDIRGMAHIRTIDLDPDADEREPVDVDAEGEGEASPGKKRFWHWYARTPEAEDATRASKVAVRLDPHTKMVTEYARGIVDRLDLPGELKRAVILAAEWHDLGKGRETWQRGIGNRAPKRALFAKPGKDPVTGQWLRPRESGSRYRHEFGSLLDVLDANQREFEELSEETQDVVLHLIAAHHGYARPHFPPEAMIDPNVTHQAAEEASVQALRRFARLQRRYGRWGLAHLESLLRAADWAASANPTGNGGEA
jgi:CRISPR-associated endonuclease/helicase Cas3